MSDRERIDNTSRRAFLRSTISVGAGAAAVLTAGTAAAAVGDDAAVAAEQPADQKGYKLTQHVADYYKIAAL